LFEANNRISFQKISSNNIKQKSNTPNPILLQRFVIALIAQLETLLTLTSTPPIDVALSAPPTTGKSTLIDA